MSADPNRRPIVVAVGLGPAGPEHTTPAAVEALSGAPVVFLRTSRHPAAASVARARERGRPRSLLRDRRDLRRGVPIDRRASCWPAAAEHGRVAYAVPGSPAVAERTVELLRSEASVELEVVPGMSFCELAWARLGIDPIESGRQVGGRGELRSPGRRRRRAVARRAVLVDRACSPRSSSASTPIPDRRSCFTTWAWPTRSSSRSRGPRSTGRSRPTT